MYLVDGEVLNVVELEDVCIILEMFGFYRNSYNVPSQRKIGSIQDRLIMMLIA